MNQAESTNGVNFQVGDVVTLKSTSHPQMTIKFIRGGDAICIWFNHNGGVYELCREEFPLETLDRMVDDEDDDGSSTHS